MTGPNGGERHNPPGAQLAVILGMIVISVVVGGVVVLAALLLIKLGVAIWRW